MLSGARKPQHAAPRFERPLSMLGNPGIRLRTNALGAEETTPRPVTTPSGTAQRTQFPCNVFVPFTSLVFFVLKERHPTGKQLHFPSTLDIQDMVRIMLGY